MIDALDELSVAQQHEALALLKSWTAHKSLQLLVTSRTHTNIQAALTDGGGWPTIMIDKACIQGDISCYVKAEIASSELAELEQSLRVELERELISKGSGM